MNPSEFLNMRASRLVAILAMTLAAAAVYLPGLSGPFIFDDTPNIVDKPEIQMQSISLEALSEAATAYGSGFPHRPVSTISLALDYWLWGDEPFGFKITNLVIHLITFVSIFLLARQLFRLTMNGEGQRRGFWPALTVAGIWAVHPLQVSTVLYVVQRMEILAALFIVLSLLAYVSARKRLQSGAPGGWWLMVAAGCSTVLAVLSKETGALAPLFMLVIELLVFRFATAARRAARVLKLGFGAIVTSMLLFYLFWLIPEFVFGDHYVKREFDWDERLLTQLRVLPMYLGWILFPAIENYLFYYDHYLHSESLIEPVMTLLGGLLLLGIGLAVWLLRRRAPLAALGIVWFFVAHALTSNLVSLELAFEHRNYLALFGVVLSLAVLVRAGFGLLTRASDVLLPAISAALFVGVGLLAFIRSATWGDEMTLGLHHVQVNPLSERAGLDLAEIYLGNDSWSSAGSPFVGSALAELERVAKLPGSRTTAEQALIILAAQRGDPSPDEAWKRLIRKVDARALDEPDYDALYHLVQARYRGVDISDERLWQLHAALCKRSDIPAEIHARFGYYAALVLEDQFRATSAFRQAEHVLEEAGKSTAPLLEAVSDAGVRLAEGIEACESVPAG